jgi:hypothetical protein
MRLSFPTTSTSTFTSIALLTVLALSAPAPAAGQTRWVPAHDPALHAKAPTMVGHDGTPGLLRVPEGFAERAAVRRKPAPRHQDLGGISLMGEVVVLEGNDEIIATDGNLVQVRMAAVARKVIERFGDNFQAMTLWLTFNETVTSEAGAYEATVKTDVRGLGYLPRDVSRTYGSGGALRSMLNMKRVWQGVREDTEEAWRPQLEIWGQESGHRWMMFMAVRDPRTALPSDVLLGRDCSHYSRYVDSQGSVHDGLAWADNRDGTFSAEGRRAFRFGNLDLYGMGLLPPDEMPGFFFIDDIPGYQRQTCSQYASNPKPLQNTISGTRVEVSIDDIVAANGPRIPSFDELLAGARQDYFREAQVVVTRVGEPAGSPLVVQVAQRIDRARLFWESWMRTATRNRMVVCTQVSRDCGDPRSDVAAVRFNPTGRAPGWGPLEVEVDLTNPGQREATGVRIDVEARVDGKLAATSRTVGTLPVGASRSATLPVDLRGHPCGAELTLKAASQSDFHYHRKLQHLVLGAEPAVQDGFEADSGWRVDPDGADTSAGAIWERGTPERTELTPGSAVQPEGAHSGTGAWVTGAAARSSGRDPFVRSGRTTLESPVFEASAWREPRVRYWVSFAGMKAAASGTGVVPSAEGRLIVQARGPGATWVEIDRLENQITVGWKLRSVALPAELTGSPLQFRFVAEDATPQTGGVEAAIDDLEVTSNLPACYQPPPPADRGGGCLVASRTATSSGFSLVAGAGLSFLALRRLRRKRPK